MDAILLNKLCGKTVDQVKWEDNQSLTLHFTDGTQYYISADCDYGSSPWLEVKELD